MGGEVARAHAGRIHGIFIRDVTQESRDAPRYARAFEGIDASLWHVLRDGDAWPLPLPTRLPRTIPARGARVAAAGLFRWPHLRRSRELPQVALVSLQLPYRFLALRRWRAVVEGRDGAAVLL